ncbi:uncharacterized protein CLUP02_00447 [Colletotrichum lupini]|uniref:Uncharacterized protein n=1 Tax=Colletotrichum lupini TaxID=145971 RepID=A0A9Q8SAU4_9PEZI|nr:uncharacterized protein CLUP02_00447 [Colletotrichum lupini]UQC73800.1 hypothetical protein CLUP02_00447 [Colletotrichum lupini]
MSSHITLTHGLAHTRKTHVSSVLEQEERVHDMSRTRERTLPPSQVNWDNWGPLTLKQERTGHFCKALGYLEQRHMNRLWVGTRVRAACPLPGVPCCPGALHSPLHCWCTFLALFSLFLRRPMSYCARYSLSYLTLAGTGCDDNRQCEADLVSSASGRGLQCSASLPLLHTAGPAQPGVGGDRLCAAGWATADLQGLDTALLLPLMPLNTCTSCAFSIQQEKKYLSRHRTFFTVKYRVKHSYGYEATTPFNVLLCFHPIRYASCSASSQAVFCQSPAADFSYWGAIDSLRLTACQRRRSITRPLPSSLNTINTTDKWAPTMQTNITLVGTIFHHSNPLPLSPPLLIIITLSPPPCRRKVILYECIQLSNFFDPLLFFHPSTQLRGTSPNRQALLRTLPYRYLSDAHSMPPAAWQLPSPNTDPSNAIWLFSRFASSSSNNRVISAIISTPVVGRSSPTQEREWHIQFTFRNPTYKTYDRADQGLGCSHVFPLPRESRVESQVLPPLKSLFLRSSTRPSCTKCLRPLSQTHINHCSFGTAREYAARLSMTTSASKHLRSAPYEPLPSSTQSSSDKLDLASPLALAEHPRAYAVNEDRQSVVKATPFRNAIALQYRYNNTVPRESKYPPLLSNGENYRWNTDENPRPSRLRCCRFPLVCVDFLLAAASTSSINYAGLQCYGNEVQKHVSKSRNKVTLELFERPPACYFWPIPHGQSRSKGPVKGARVRQYKVQGLPAAPPYQRFKGAWSWKGSIAGPTIRHKRLEVDKMVWLMPSPLSYWHIGRETEGQQLNNLQWVLSQLVTRKGTTTTSTTSRRRYRLFSDDLHGCEHKPGAKLGAWRGLVALASSREIDARPSGEGFQNSSRRHRRRVSRRGITAASKGWAAPPSRRFICDEGGVLDVNLSLEGLFLLSTPSGILREDYKARPQSQAPCVVSALNRGALARADWGPVSHWPIGFTVIGIHGKGACRAEGFGRMFVALAARSNARMAALTYERDSRLQTSSIRRQSTHEKTPDWQIGPCRPQSRPIDGRPSADYYTQYPYPPRQGSAQARAHHGISQTPTAEATHGLSQPSCMRASAEIAAGDFEQRLSVRAVQLRLQTAQSVEAHELLINRRGTDDSRLRTGAKADERSGQPEAGDSAEVCCQTISLGESARRVGTICFRRYAQIGRHALVVTNTDCRCIISSNAGINTTPDHFTIYQALDHPSLDTSAAAGKGWKIGVRQPPELGGLNSFHDCSMQDSFLFILPWRITYDCATRPLGLLRPSLFSSSTAFQVPRQQPAMPLVAGELSTLSPRHSGSMQSAHCKAMTGHEIQRDLASCHGAMASACPLPSKFCSIYTSSAAAGSANGLCSSLSLYSADCTGICVCIHIVLSRSFGEGRETEDHVYFRPFFLYPYVYFLRCQEAIGIAVVDDGSTHKFARSSKTVLGL